jgi:hypothetical protein
VRLATLGAIAVVTCSAVFAQRPVVCPQEYLDLKAINAITRATSCDAIDTAYSRVLAPDDVTKLIYASHRVRRCPGEKSDDRLISSLPGDAITFSLLYSLTYPNEAVAIDKAAVELASGLWLDLALDAVIRRGKGGSAFLMQAYFGSGNADIGEMFPDLHSEFRRRSPKAFAAAFRVLPDEAKQFVHDEP